MLRLTALMRNMTTMALLTMFIISKIVFLNLDDHSWPSSSIMRRLVMRCRRLVHASKWIVSIYSNSLNLPVFLLAYALISLHSRHDTTSRELRPWIFSINPSYYVFFIPLISDFLELNLECRSFIPLFLKYISMCLFRSWIWGWWPLDKFHGLLFRPLIKCRQVDVIVSNVFWSS